MILAEIKLEGMVFYWGLGAQGESQPLAYAWYFEAEDCLQVR